MHIHGAILFAKYYSQIVVVYQPEPIIPNKIALDFAIRYVATSVWVDILFRKPKINHVYRLLVGW
jgi:hypothetical protein